MHKRYLLCLVACVTLGLAPFRPQPHLLEKIRWLVAGTPQLRTIDWVDVVFHGTPWLVLIVMLIADLTRTLSKQKPPV
jgi:hypothetical protein